MNKVVNTKMFMRLKVANNAFLSYDLMNVFLIAASAVMRLKLYKFIKLPLYLFAEIRAEEKEKSTHRVNLEKLSAAAVGERREEEKKEERKRWRHHSNHQSYVCEKSEKTI